MAHKNLKFYVQKCLFLNAFKLYSTTLVAFHVLANHAITVPWCDKCEGDYPTQWEMWGSIPCLLVPTFIPYMCCILHTHLAIFVYIKFMCHLLSFFWFHLIIYHSTPVGKWGIAISLSVCVYVSASISLEPLDQTSWIFYADPLWPWLGPPLAALRYVMYFRFYGWRHVWP